MIKNVIFTTSRSIIPIPSAADVNIRIKATEPSINLSGLFSASIVDTNGG